LGLWGVVVCGVGGGGLVKCEDAPGRKIGENHLFLFSKKREDGMEFRPPDQGAARLRSGGLKNTTGTHRRGSGGRNKFEGSMRKPPS